MFHWNCNESYHIESLREATAANFACEHFFWFQLAISRTAISGHYRAFANNRYCLHHRRSIHLSNLSRFYRRLRYRRRRLVHLNGLIHINRWHRILQLSALLNIFLKYWCRTHFAMVVHTHSIAESLPTILARVELIRRSRRTWETLVIAQRMLECKATPTLAALISNRMHFILMHQIVVYGLEIGRAHRTHLVLERMHRPTMFLQCQRIFEANITFGARMQFAHRDHHRFWQHKLI